MNITSANGQTIRLRVVERRDEASDVVSLNLECDGEFSLPNYTAGAHIELRLPGGVRRKYSLCNDPASVGRYTIAVHRSPKSRGGSSWIHDSLFVGDSLEATLPRNDFPLVPDVDVILIAGGIGVTPLLSMIYELKRAGRSWQLHYAVRSRPQAAFLAQLESLADFPKQVNLHVDEEENSLLDIEQIVSGSKDSSHIYCCGPVPMIDKFAAVTTHMVDRTHVERFSASQDASKPKTDSSFEVYLAKSEKSLTIDDSTTILQELKLLDIDVNYSCEEGICGDCEIKVLKGIPEHRDSVLSAEEKASNSTMMVCVSRCSEQTLVLDI